MALAMEFNTTGDRSYVTTRRSWQGKEFWPPLTSVPPSGHTDQQSTGPPNPSNAKSRDYSKLPVVRLTAAEKAEKTRLGLCWYCSEKWASGHICKGRFLAYIGSDDDDDEVEDTQTLTQPRK